MGKAYKYNVYDNGKLVLNEVTHRVIVNAIGCTTINIGLYADRKTKWKDRYTFELCGDAQPEIKETAFAREWNATVALFKNVIWVKSGGKSLKVGGRR